MSEAPARTGGARTRGGYRSGRGGYRGTRNPSKSQSKYDETDVPETTLDEQGEVGELKRKYGDKIPLLREVCPGWSDEDLVFALQETEGNVDAAVDRISSGTISQWGEVKKKPGKAKEGSHGGEHSSTRGRGRGAFEGRGRGRGAERGSSRAVSRGARAGHQSNGTKSVDKGGKEVEDGLVMEETPGDHSTNGDEVTTPEPTVEPKSTPAIEPKPQVSAQIAGKVGGWAGLFAKPPPAPAPKKASVPTIETSVPVTGPDEPTPVPATVVDTHPAEHTFVPPPIIPLVVEDTASDLPSAPHSDTAEDITPSADRLTEKNLEKLPDISHPQESATAVSTVASTQDPMAGHEPSKPIIRPGMSGFAATALKATSNVGRSASYNKRLIEQQEAVVMPGNMAMEKATVQFGKMGLSGSDDVDVDEDREEPETRTQLPDDSPVAPRASLPPATTETQQPTEAQHAQPQHQTAPQPSLEPAPVAAAPSQVPRPAPGLSNAAGLPSIPQQPHQPSPPVSSSFTDPYRYGQGQKAYDPFGQQPQQAPPQEPFSNQVPTQSSHQTGQNDYSSYYGRDAYQNYYNMFGHGQGQESGRPGTHGSSTQDSQGQYGATRPQAGHAQESNAQGSGNNTPNPTAASHHGQPSQQVHGQSGQANYGYGYPNYNQQYPQYSASYMNQMRHSYGANRPMFDDVRREAEYYQNQYAYSHNQQYGSKYNSNMYGQPGQQYSYEHSSSPANTTNFGGREGGYGRSGSAQPQEGQQHSAGSSGNTYGGVPDPFGRSSSGFGQSQGISQQPGSHQVGDDAHKASGPSPSMQGGRPGSTTGQQGSMPGHQQSSQQAFGGYPQYAAGFGNLGGHQTGNQNSGYSGYGSNAGFNAYSGYSAGRGWNGNNYGTGH